MNYFITLKNKKFLVMREKFFQLRYKCYSYLQIISRENDAFIINPYLPFKEEIKLELSLSISAIMEKSKT